MSVAPAAPGTTPGTTEAPAGHDEAMVAKFDATQAAAVAAAGSTADPVVQAPVKPEGVPDKFWNAEKGEVNFSARSKSHGELEAKFTQSNQAATTTAAAAAVTPTADAATAAVGADSMAAYSTEFAEKGELSAASFQALEAKGIPKAMVDAYIAGQQAIAERIEAQAHTLVGGKDQMSAMLDWAGKNLNQAEIDSYNRATMSGQEADRNQAILGLKARFEQSHGSSQAGLVNGQAASTVAGFASQAEMTKAMKDPQYQTDPAYRALVERRLEATTAF